jgi:hypothetical protein
LNEVGIIGKDGLVVIDPQSSPFIFWHAVAVKSSDLRELVYKLLLNTDGVVGSAGIDSPLEAVLLWVILGQEERVVVGFYSRYKYHVVLSNTGRHEFPERVKLWILVVCLQGDCPIMMEPQESFASCDLFILLSIERL